MSVCKVLNIQPDESTFDLEQEVHCNAQVQVFKALAHPTRLAILEILRAGEQCVCEIEKSLGQRQAYISQQLAVLRAIGLVQDKRQGYRIIYRISDLAIFHMLDAAKNWIARKEFQAEGGLFHAFGGFEGSSKC